MRYIRYACIIVFALVLIAVAMANNEAVTVQLLPSGISYLFSVTPKVQLPLFIIIFTGIVVGLLVGFVWEWMREYKVRAENARNIREVSRLNREVKRLRGDKYDGKDDIFALLDQAS